METSESNTKLTDNNFQEKKLPNDEGYLLLERIIVKGLAGYKAEQVFEFKNGRLTLIGPGGSGKSSVLNLIRKAIIWGTRQSTPTSEEVSRLINSSSRIEDAHLELTFAVSKTGQEVLAKGLALFEVMNAEGERRVEKDMKFEREYVNKKSQSFFNKCEKLTLKIQDFQEATCSTFISLSTNSGNFKIPIATDTRRTHSKPELLKALNLKESSYDVISVYEYGVQEKGNFIAEIFGDKANLNSPFHLIINKLFSTITILRQDRGLFSKSDVVDITGDGTIEYLQKWAITPSHQTKFNALNDELKVLTGFSVLCRPTLPTVVKQIKDNIYPKMPFQTAKARLTDIYLKGKVDALHAINYLEDLKKDVDSKTLQGFGMLIPETETASDENVLFTNSTKLKFTIDECPGTVQTLVMILVAIFRNKAGTILLDEPDLSLYPSKIRELKRFFNSIDRKHNHLLLVTHSSVLLDEDSIPSIYHIIQKDNLSSAKKLEDANITSNRYAMDPLLCEIYFSSKILFCEGPNDARYLQQLLSIIRRYPKVIPGVNVENIEKWTVLALGGSGTFKPIKYAQDLEIPIAILYDRDVIGSMKNEDEFSKSRAASNIKGIFGNDALQNFKKLFVTSQDEARKFLKANFNIIAWDGEFEHAVAKVPSAVEDLFNASPYEARKPYKSAQEFAMEPNKKKGLHNDWGRIPMDAISSAIEKLLDAAVSGQLPELVVLLTLLSTEPSLLSTKITKS